MFKLIIAGGRDFDDYQLAKEKVLKIICNITDEIEIVSGGAKGADKIGEILAQELNFGLKIFPADWKSYGKAAEMLRNAQMANYADALIAFYDGKSKGTKNMNLFFRKT